MRGRFGNGHRLQFNGSNHLSFGRHKAIIKLVYSLYQFLALLGSNHFKMCKRVGVTRIAPTSATTTLRFSLSEPVGENVLIPQGTRVTSDSTHYFATTAAAVIEVGQIAVEVEAASVEGGSSYNGIPIGGINALVDSIVYVDRVTNITETSGGCYEEGDDSFRERIKAEPSKLSTAGPIKGYQYWAMSADSKIIDVTVKSEQETLTHTLPIYGGKAFTGGDTLLLDTIDRLHRQRRHSG